MRLILTIAGLAPEFGGPSRSVPALASALARGGIEVELITCAAPAGGSAPVPPGSDQVKTHLVPAHCRTTQWLARANGFAVALRERCGTATSCVVHDNGLWLPTNHAVAYAARKLKQPLIVSPRGMLSAWALQFKGLKKRFAWHLFQKRDLRSAQVLHATSREEADGFLRAGLRQPITVVANGVELPPPRSSSLSLRWRAGRAQVSPTPSTVTPPSSLRTVLFLSRIHPVKGLLNLVQAWAAVRPQGWRVVLAGADADGHRAELEAAIHRYRLNADFQSIGPVDGEKKWDLYRSADLFVLPSYAENFGLAVAEALACGVPVITTRATPWEDLPAHGCGWWVEVGAQPLAEVLREATAMTDEKRHAMGQRGRRLIEQKFTWSAAAQKMIAVYEWMLKGGPKPECVVPPEDSR